MFREWNLLLFCLLFQLPPQKCLTGFIHFSFSISFLFSGVLDSSHKGFFSLVFFSLLSFTLLCVFMLPSSGHKLLLRVHLMFKRVHKPIKVIHLLFSYYTVLKRESQSFCEKITLWFSQRHLLNWPSFARSFINIY